MIVDSGAAPPPVPPRRKVTKASVGNRDQSHHRVDSAKGVPVRLILLMVHLPKCVQSNSISKWWYEACSAVVKLSGSVLPLVMKC